MTFCIKTKIVATIQQGCVELCKLYVILGTEKDSKSHSLCRIETVSTVPCALHWEVGIREVGW